MLRNTIKAHREHCEKECLNQPIVCPTKGKGCTRMLTRRSMQQHLDTDCPVNRRLINMAKRNVKRRMLVQCSDCGVEMMVRHYNRHRDHECRCRIVPCRFWDCKAKVQADKWIQHVLNDCEHSQKWRVA